MANKGGVLNANDPHLVSATLPLIYIHSNPPSRQLEKKKDKHLTERAIKLQTLVCCRSFLMVRIKFYFCLIQGTYFRVTISSLKKKTERNIFQNFNNEICS